MRAESSKTTGKRSTKPGPSSLARTRTRSRAELLATPDVPDEPIATSIRFTATQFVLRLEDGREVAVPLEWSPLLRDAPRSKLRNVEFVDGGRDLHWPDLDEDMHIVDLLYPPRFAAHFK